jgi:hypothetical protein
MNNYLFLIFGYFAIFLSILLTFYRIKKTDLSKEDLRYWHKLELKFLRFKSKLLKIIQISEEEIIYLWKNFLEKTFMRIKIFGLKMENWATYKLEKLRRNSENKI